MDWQELTEVTDC